VSSISMNASPSTPVSSRGTAVASPARTRVWTASSRPTCPKVNERRNVPNVDGASDVGEEPWPSRRAAARRGHRWSRLRRASPRPHRRPSPGRSGRERSNAPRAARAGRPCPPAASPGPNPPNRSGSGHRKPRIPCAMLPFVGCPFGRLRSDPSQVQSSRAAWAFACHDPPNTPTNRWIRAQLRPSVTTRRCSSVVRAWIWRVSSVFVFSSSSDSTKSWSAFACWKAA